MRWISATLLILVLGAMAGPLLAHGGKAHLQGTILDTGHSRIEVKTTDGRILWVRMNSQTRIRDEKGLASLSDLRKGERVVLHLTATGKHPTASEVRISSHAAEGSTGGGAHHHVHS